MSTQSAAGANRARDAQAEAKVETNVEKKGRKAVNNAAKSNDKGKDAKNAVKVKKGVTPGLAALMVVVGTLILVLAAFILLFFNVFALKDMTVAFLQQGSSPYQEQIDALAKKQIDLDEWALELSTKETELVDKDQTLIKRESELAAREAQLKAWDGELLVLEESLGGKQVQLSQLVAIFEKMDVSTAARILESMPSMDDQLTLLMNMKQSTVSNILSAMDPTLAAQLATNMLNRRQMDGQ